MSARRRRARQLRDDYDDGGGGSRGAAFWIPAVVTTAVVVGIVWLLAVMFFGTGETPVDPKDPALRALWGYPGARAALPGSWRAQEFGDVRLDAPVKLRPPEETVIGRMTTEKMGRLPALILRSAVGESEDLTFYVWVSEYGTRPSVPVDLANMAEVVHDTAENLGAARPAASLLRTKVDGFEAVRTAAQAITDDRYVSVDLLAIRRGSSVWTVFVQWTGSRATDDAHRVLDSVRIAPLPKAGTQTEKEPAEAASGAEPAANTDDAPGTSDK